jgi:hypothetical protein
VFSAHQIGLSSPTALHMPRCGRSQRPACVNNFYTPSRFCSPLPLLYCMGRLAAPFEATHALRVYVLLGRSLGFTGPRGPSPISLPPSTKSRLLRPSTCFIAWNGLRSPWKPYSPRACAAFRGVARLDVTCSSRRPLTSSPWRTEQSRACCASASDVSVTAD